jgi:hypothetical protein
MQMLTHAWVMAWIPAVLCSGIACSWKDGMVLLCKRIFRTPQLRNLQRLNCYRAGNIKDDNVRWWHSADGLHDVF